MICCTSILKVRATRPGREANPRCFSWIRTYEKTNDLLHFDFESTGYQSLRSRDNRTMEKQKQNKPDGRCATCPRWDRWYIRIPTPKDQQKIFELYRRSGAKTKSDFLRARLLGESFKIITEDESAEEYYHKLSNITARIQKIGILYNQTVKAINSYQSIKTAQIILQKSEQYPQQMIILEQQAIELTLDYQKR